jgi:hypothetical protein
MRRRRFLHVAGMASAGLLSARGPPDEVWANLVFWTASPPAGISLSIAGLSFGSGDALRQSLDALVAGVGRAPLYRTQTTIDYRDLLVGGAGCPTSKVSECHLPGQTPGRAPAT